MKKVYLVRHGESEYNAGGEIKPQNEISLTELGHKQADFVALRVCKINPGIIISSTLLRARETAQHIAGATGLHIETTDLITERRYPSGSMGLTNRHPEVQEVEKLMIERFGDEGYTHSDEELFPELKDRALKALEFFANRPEEVIVAVSHGVFLRVLLAATLFGKELTAHEAGRVVQKFKTKNTGLSLFEYDETGWSVRVWNDHAHLG